MTDIEQSDTTERRAGVWAAAPPPIDHRFAPSMTWTGIGRPDDRHKTLVDQRGRHLYGFQPPLDDEAPLFRLSFRQVLSVRLHTGVEATTVRQRLLHPAAAVVETVHEHPHAELALTSFAHADGDGRRADAIAWTITARHDSIDASLAVQIADSGVWSVIAPHPLDAAAEIRRAGEGAAWPLHRVVSPDHHLRVSSADDFGPSSAFATDPVTLQRGESLSGVLLIPLDGEVELPADANAAQLVGDELDFWMATNPTGRFGRLPEPSLAALVTASARTIAQNRERTNGVPSYNVGPSIYRGHWVLDGYFLLEAARFLGHHADADAATVDLFRSGSAASGLTTIIPGHLKEPAVAIATAVRQAELGAGLERLAAWWPAIETTIDQLVYLSPGMGAISPPAFADGGIGGMREEWTTALWWLVGFDSARRAARYLGHEPDHLDSRYEHLRRRVLEQADRDRRHTADGVPYWPMLRDGSGDHRFRPGFADGVVAPWFRVNAASATYALAHAIHPGEQFAPDDRTVVDLLALLDAIEGDEAVPEGTGWLPHRSVWTYSAAIYAQAALWAGDNERALRYLHGFANHASHTLVWREEQAIHSSAGARVVGDMPHGWASAELIRLVRNLVVFEHGDDLALLHGVPAAWFGSGGELSFTDTPTRFGPASVSASYISDTSWRITATAPSGGPAALLTCRVHLPAGGTAQDPVLQDGVRLADGATAVDLRSGQTTVIERGGRSATAAPSSHSHSPLWGTR